MLTSTIFEATSSGSSDANSSFSHERSVELPQSALPESLTARSPTAESAMSVMPALPEPSARSSWRKPAMRIFTLVPSLSCRVFACVPSSVPAAETRLYFFAISRPSVSLDAAAIFWEIWDSSSHE